MITNPQLQNFINSLPRLQNGTAICKIDSPFEEGEIVGKAPGNGLWVMWKKTKITSFIKWNEIIVLPY